MAGRNLSFTLKLIDKFTRPLRKVKAQMQALDRQASAAANRLRDSFVGGVGAVVGFRVALQPAIDMSMAMGEVASLGVGAEQMELPKRSAMDFTSQFGGNAVDVVRSAYDIQSAIAGLTGRELSEFTTAAGVMAKATKADTQTVTAYLGTMYGIFQQQADAMGRADWVQGVAGQFAQSVQMFKTNGQEMSAAFSNLGAGATSAGVSMNEQFAVLGRLQSTMSGSEAATKYRSFLANVGRAQQALGLTFTDSSGKMLAMPAILEKIGGKYGDIDTVAKSDAFKKAFGSEETEAAVGAGLANVHGENRGNAVIPGAAAAIRNVSNSTQDRSSRIGRLVVNTDRFDADKFRTLLEMEALG